MYPGQTILWILSIKLLQWFGFRIGVFLESNTVHSRGVMDFRLVAVQVIVIFVVIACIRGLCGQSVIMHYYDKYDYS
jgi:hypothetical protein